MRKILLLVAVIVVIGVVTVFAIPQSRLFVTATFGNTTSQFTLGQKLIEKTDKESVQKGLHWVTKAAEHGNSDAQLFLGRAYNSGDYVSRDLATATKWWKKAADNHNVLAASLLGTCYIFGRGVEKNEREAERLLLTASKAGYAEAQCNLAGLYQLQGDSEKQVYWLKQAANKGDSLAETALAEMAYNDKDYRLAESMARDAASKGNANANYLLGEMYKWGTGVQRDMSTAVSFYKIAAEQNNDAAQFQLGLMYETGYGVEKNMVEANKWFDKSAAQGNTKSQVCLAREYFTGAGAPQDYEKAYFWATVSKAKSDDRETTLRANQLLGALHFLMSADQIAKSQKEASDWWGKNKPSYSASGAEVKTY